MKTTKELLAMPLHTSVEIETESGWTFDIIRVPGGWIYTNLDIFVPEPNYSIAGKTIDIDENDQKPNTPWVSVEDKPLVTFVKDHPKYDYIFEDALEIIAAIPLKGGEWWIRHCILRDGSGLCVREGEYGEEEPAYYSITDVTKYIVIENPKG